MDYCGAKTREGGKCQRPAGWGTKHPKAGRCKLHGGCCTGPPLGSQNALKHGLYAKFALTDEEIQIAEEFPIDGQAVLDYNIRLAAVRQRRMLQRIADLQAAQDESGMTIVQVESTDKPEVGGDALNGSGRKEIRKGALGQMQEIEGALSILQSVQIRAVEAKTRKELALLQVEELGEDGEPQAFVIVDLRREDTGDASSSGADQPIKPGQ